MRRKAHRVPTAPFVLHRTRIGKCKVKKFRINCQWLNGLFWLSCFIFHLENPRWMFRAFVNSKSVTFCRGFSNCKWNLMAHYWRSIFLTTAPFLPLFPLCSMYLLYFLYMQVVKGGGGWTCLLNSNCKDCWAFIKTRDLVPPLTNAQWIFTSESDI